MGTAASKTNGQLLVSGVGRRCCTTAMPPLRRHFFLPYFFGDESLAVGLGGCAWSKCGPNASTCCFCNRDFFVSNYLMATVTRRTEKSSSEF